MPSRGQHKRGGPLRICGGDYLGTLDRNGTSCLVHRACWEAHNGPIPPRHEIHHKNGETLDNHIENLACVSRAEHKIAHSGPVDPTGLHAYWLELQGVDK